MNNAILFFLFIAQGVIHLQGVFAATNKMQTKNWNVESSFIDRFFSGKNHKVIALVLYALASTLFFSAAFSYEALFVPGSVWLNLLVTAISISFIGLDIFPHAIGVYVNRYFAIAINILIAVFYFYIYSGLQLSP